ncbi:hypothetical protein Val02_73260 [Virgisporangium aliadipatigenens]|uniref:Uncharacterized protein n=1 Tax=Virgisporangium aliadipatigenens TaxID=741659 RepID=A0A8J4DTP9_9ACTN|nr:hypothetical protein [Virgisporangium aliadipatigenens]GIJ50440.1 hypothetical protein Val02_73260 [Virgisporangium aliadipatigenens]
MAHVHLPRVAWDGARALIYAAQDAESFAPAAARLAGALPDEYWDAYMVTRNRIVRPHRPDADAIEAGLWRQRFSELLVLRPDLADVVRGLADGVISDIVALGRRPSMHV